MLQKGIEPFQFDLGLVGNIGNKKGQWKVVTH